MIPLGKEHNQKVLKLLHDRGIEVTPNELVETRKKAYAKIRKAMRAIGWDVPDDDTELFLLICEVMNKNV